MLAGSYLSAGSYQRTHLADDLSSLRIPAERPVVFPAGEEEIGILFTPRDGKHAFVVTAEDLSVSSDRVETLTLSGAPVFRRSQSIMMGDSSSSDAVIRRVA